MRCTLTSVTKKYCWIWIAVDRVGKKFINCSFGSRGTETGQKLWEKLKEKEIEIVMTDHWKAYAEFIPETIHTQSKAEMYTVEGYNGILTLSGKIEAKDKVLYEES